MSKTVKLPFLTSSYNPAGKGWLGSLEISLTLCSSLEDYELGIMKTLWIFSFSFSDVYFLILDMSLIQSSIFSQDSLIPIYSSFYNSSVIFSVNVLSLENKSIILTYFIFEPSLS